MPYVRWRKAVVTVSRITDPGTGDLLATYIDGEPQAVLTIHRTAQDPDWSADRQRGKAWAAFMLYTLAPLVLALFIGLHLSPIGLGVALATVAVASVLCKNPVQAFRLTFLDVRCKRHSRPAIGAGGLMAGALKEQCGRLRANGHFGMLYVVEHTFVR